MRASVTVLGFLATTGCLPVMPHPTRVDPAFRVGTNVSFTLVTDSAVQTGKVERTAVPAIDVSASLGYRDTTRSDGFGVQLSGNVGFSGYGGGLYTELPRDLFGDLDAGLGFSAHKGAYSTLAPYAQVGRRLGNNSWFLRNVLFIVTRRDSVPAYLLWAPVIGFYGHGPAVREGSVYVAGVIGRQPRVERYCVFLRCFGYSNSFTSAHLIVGMSASFRLSTDMMPRPFPVPGR